MSADKPVEVVAGSTKYLKFTITDADTGEVVNVSSCTASLSVKNSSGTSLITKTNTDFDKSSGASGILRVLCAFATAGRYTGYLTITLSTTTDVLTFGVVVLPGA